MFTKNYYNLQMLCALYPQTYPVYSIRSISGASITPLYPSDGYMLKSIIPTNFAEKPADVGSSSNITSYVVFGVGTNAENISDYTITSLPSSVSLSATFGSRYNITYNEEEKSYTNSIKLAIINKGTAKANISEYGLFSSIQTGSSSWTEYMFYRELLTQPFEIDINETVNFQLTVKMFMPDGTRTE